MDIVKQLRKQNIGGNFPDDYVSYAAADEIERLREALSVAKGMLSEHLPSEEKCEMTYNYLAGVKHDGTR